MRIKLFVVLGLVSSLACAGDLSPQLFNSVIDRATERSLKTNLPAEYIEYLKNDFETKQKENITNISCSSLEDKANQTIKDPISPKQLLTAIAKKAPQILLIGETHLPKDFMKWEKDTIAEYRKMRPGVDCVFKEDRLFTLDAELKFFGKDSYLQSHNVEATVEAFAKEKHLSFESFKDEKSDVFSMRIGEGNPIMEFEDEIIRREEAYVNSTELVDAFEKNLKTIYVDFRHSAYNRDVFMTSMMSGLIKNGFCKNAVGIFGMAHLQTHKYLLEKSGISTYSVALWNSNGFKINDFTYGSISLPGFMDYSNKCSSSNISLPQSPFAFVSKKVSDIAPHGSKGQFMTLDTFDAHIVGPVLPVSPDMRNYRNVINIYK
jgi:hypothetical protein